MRDLAAKSRPTEDASARQEKERKREERALKKMAKAAGVKLATFQTVAGNVKLPAVELPLETEDSVGTSFQAAPRAASSKGFKSSGWATVGLSALPAIPAVVAALPTPVASSTPGRGFTRVNNLASLPSIDNAPADSTSPDSTPRHISSTTAHPTFRSSGWTNMEHLDEVQTTVDSNKSNMESVSMDYMMQEPPPPLPISAPPPFPPLPGTIHPAPTPDWREHFASSPSPHHSRTTNFQDSSPSSSYQDPSKRSRWWDR